MIRLVARPEPLIAIAVAARGPAARALARRLRGRTGLVAVSAGDRIVALADDPESLPWIDGVTWLGRDPEAPALLVPTRLAVEPHPALVLRALARSRDDLPLALVPDRDRVLAIPLGPARPPGGAELEAFLATEPLP